jgi:hypothetical protein
LLLPLPGTILLPLSLAPRNPSLVPRLAGEVGGVEEEGAVKEDGGGPLALKFLLYLRLTSFPVWYAG